MTGNAALRAFFQGYLHEDYRAEYGSAVAAARAFVYDAGAAERSTVARALAELLDEAESWPWTRLVGYLGTELGSRWRPPSRRSLRAVAAVLAGGDGATGEGVTVEG